MTYKKYVLDALRLFVSGYVLKPAMEKEIREVLDNLRDPFKFQNEGLYIKCFGNYAAINNPILTVFNNEYMKQYSWAETSLSKIYLSILNE